MLAADFPRDDEAEGQLAGFRRIAAYRELGQEFGQPAHEGREFLPDGLEAFEEPLGILGEGLVLGRLLPAHKFVARLAIRSVAHDRAEGIPDLDLPIELA